MLERAREVEERLRAGAHRDEWMAGDGAQVRADVAALVRAAVYAADATGREHADARVRGEAQGRGHRRRAEGPALRDRNRDLTLAHLVGRAEDSFVFVLRDADAWYAVEDCGDRGHCTVHPDRGEATGERVRVGRAGQTEVREDRRLERHDCTIAGECVGDLVGDTDRWRGHDCGH